MVPDAKFIGQSNGSSLEPETVISKYVRLLFTYPKQYIRHIEKLIMISLMLRTLVTLQSQVE